MKAADIVFKNTKSRTIPVHKYFPGTACQIRDVNDNITGLSDPVQAAEELEDRLPSLARV